MNRICNKLEELDLKEKDSKTPDFTYSVLSIDVGVINLGLSVSLLDKEYNLIEIIWVDLIDITKFKHQYGDTAKECKAYHTRTFADWLNHVYQENLQFFEMADYILIERQPPMGFTVVEQLIFDTWREKAILLNPTALHKYFNINHLDYESRKRSTTNICRLKIKDKRLLEQLTYYYRQNEDRTYYNRTHDIADSICMMVYWANKMNKEYVKKKKQKIAMAKYLESKKSGQTTETWFELHRYIE